MHIETTPWRAEFYRSARGGAKVDIRNESTSWFLTIRYMADNYDSALATGDWENQDLFIYPRSRPDAIVPEIYLKDGKLKCFVSMSAAGTVPVDEVQKEIENLVYVQTACEAVAEALRQYFPGILVP